MASQVGYYDVKVVTHAGVFTHRVYAPSDYAAAVMVRRETGFMPKSDCDVEFIRTIKGMSTARNAVLF